jgi:hypothetical protein
MSRLLTLREAIDAITEAFDEGDGWDRYAWVYIRGQVTEPSCRFYLSHVADEDDAQGCASVASAGWAGATDALIADHGEVLPPFAAQHHLRHFLEAADFAEVLFVQRRHHASSTLDDLARALDYYRRHDSFLGVAPEAL